MFFHVKAKGETDRKVEGEAKFVEDDGVDKVELRDSKILGSGLLWSCSRRQKMWRVFVALD
jgi:hypothetical protein